ncbi:hypothetical protein EON79_07085 [bacterium]|nr:MAG: hypothetical protein EON79_07085 [bacterium]
MAKRRPPIDLGAILPFAVPADDPGRRSAYDRAVAAASSDRVDELLLLTAEGWQAPAWSQGRENAEIGDFMKIGGQLIAEGRTEDAYRLGDALLEAGGTLIHAFIGIHLRKFSKVGPQAFSVETYHAVVRSEFDRWILPYTSQGDHQDLTDADPTYRAKQAALRWTWGGQPSAFDRAKTVEEILRARDALLAREPDEAYCMGKALAEGSWLPMGMIQFVTPIPSSVKFAMSAPAFRFRANGYGRFQLAALHASFARFSELYDISLAADRKQA